jgi:hypothetical protein
MAEDGERRTAETSFVFCFPNVWKKQSVHLRHKSCFNQHIVYFTQEKP